METVKLSTKGQIVIPKGVREAHHLAAGTEFMVSFVNNEIHLKPLPLFPATTIADSAASLAKRGRKKISEKQVRSRIAQGLKSRDDKSKS